MWIYVFHVKHIRVFWGMFYGKIYCGDNKMTVYVIGIKKLIFLSFPIITHET